MRASFIFLLITISPVTKRLIAQDISAKPNAVYLELLGNGLIYSLNYERNITGNIYVRAGGMFLGFSIGDSNPSKYRFYSFPFMLNKVIGKKKGNLELGVGLLYYSFNAESSGVQDTGYPGIIIGEQGIGLTSTVGYRHIFTNNMLFRVGFQPSYYFKSISKGLTMSPGISIGKVF